MNNALISSPEYNSVETYALVGVIVAVNVEDGQNVDVHLVEQAGHLRVTAIGGQGLGKLK